MTGASTLLDALGGLPDAVAIFCAGGGPRLTRDHLRKEVLRVSVALRKSGIRPGDAVSIADTNTVRSHHTSSPLFWLCAVEKCLKTN